MNGKTGWQRNLSRRLAKPALGRGYCQPKRAHMNGKARRLRNLRHRLAAPAKLNGRLQKQARTALHALGGEASTADIMQWCFAMKFHANERVAHWDYQSVRRALEAIGAVRVGRAPTIGRPWIWRLKDKTSSATDDKSKA